MLDASCNFDFFIVIGVLGAFDVIAGNRGGVDYDCDNGKICSVSKHNKYSN
ncbi:hypothetical protein [Candidatus Ichthyocystis sparus]|uniref:hypothetical protein n=1 Tax=Candidatus Ichthyocystis sparus TaxID=1561004 RepID=UPI00159EDB56|nr:hypothetical protein [Candidatus Ichthyocystis sparus]